MSFFNKQLPHGGAIGKSVGQTMRGTNANAWGIKKTSHGNNQPFNRPSYSPLGHNGHINPDLKMSRMHDPMRTKQIGMMSDFEDMAKSKGPTQYGQSLLDRNSANFNAQKNNMVSKGNAQVSTNLDQMAMRGGYDGGVAERMGNKMAHSNMNRMQQLDQQQNLSDLGIIADDNKYKQGMLKDVYSMYGHREGVDNNLRNMDIQRGMQEHRNIYDLDMRAYEAEMQKWASDNVADAQASAARKSSGFIPDEVPLLGGCFLTTACCELLGLPDDNNILQTFRAWRDEHLGGKEGIPEYYENAPLILEAMEAKGEVDYLYAVTSKYIIPIFKMLKEERWDDAYPAYREMVSHLTERYMEVA
jgi:hypothetical protein